MKPKPHHRSLEVPEDIVFERKNWVAERIAWFVLLLIVLAGLSGALGKGGISTQEASSSPAGMDARYERFLRYETSDELDLKIKPGGKGNSYRLLVGKELFEKVLIEQIVPAPEKEQLLAGGIAYTFAIAPNQQELALKLYVKPVSWGSLKTQLTDSEGHSLLLHHFIYP